MGKDSKTAKQVSIQQKKTFIKNNTQKICGEIYNIVLSYFQVFVHFLVSSVTDRRAYVPIQHKRDHRAVTRQQIIEQICNVISFHLQNINLMKSKDIYKYISCSPLASYLS
jgi:hypothetical protein